MSTISEKLTQLNTIKGDIKTAINNKGGEVGNDFSTYAAAINNLSTGSGGSGETYENPEFYEVRTQKGTNYDNLFRGYDGPDIDVSQWDTSKVTSILYCFSGCKKPFDISNWDLRNVKKADYMFDNSNTDYLDVRNIDISGVTEYCYLFNQCSGNELDLSNWDISNVVTLDNTFRLSNYKKLNLTNWNTINITKMNYVIYYMNNLETLLIPDWDMTNTKTVNGFMYNVSKLKYIDLSRSNDFTINKIASFLPKKTATTYGEVVIPADTSQDAIDAVTAKYWKPIGPKIDITSTELVLELDEIKPGKTTKIWISNNDPWYGDDSLEYIEFISSDESIATVNGREITGVSEGTVTIECRRREDNVIISTAPATLTVSETDSNPNLVKFRIDESTLYSYYSAITINGTGVTPNNLTKDPITGIYSYDPGAQITSVKFGYGSSYNNLSELIKFNFNAANITNMNDMFQYYKGTTLDLSDWDTSKVTSMGKMFYCSYDLVDIIGYLDLSSLEQGFFHYNAVAYNVVYGCRNLETLYLKNIYKNCTMTNEGKWSINLGDTKVKNECLLYIINELPDLYAKGLTATDNITFTLPKTNTLTAEQVQVAIDKGWTVVNCNF